MNSLVLICILLVAVSYGTYGTEPKPFPNVYKNVAPEDRKAFISFHLLKAYERIHPIWLYNERYLLRNVRPEVLSRVKSNDVLPEDFDMKLYEWTADYYNLTHLQMFRLARGELICVPPESDECVDSGDAGGICCT